jgi:hypothetical protein
MSRSQITTDGQRAIQSWCEAPFGAQDQVFVIVSCGFVDVGRPLSREDGCVIYRSHLKTEFLLNHIQKLVRTSQETRYTSPLQPVNAVYKFVINM